MITLDTRIESLKIDEKDSGFLPESDFKINGFKSISDVDRYLYNLEIMNYVISRRILKVHANRAEINKLIESNI